MNLKQGYDMQFAPAPAPVPALEGEGVSPAPAPVTYLDSGMLSASLSHFRTWEYTPALLRNGGKEGLFAEIYFYNNGNRCDERGYHKVFGVSRDDVIKHAIKAARQGGLHYVIYVSDDICTALVYSKSLTGAAHAN